MFEENMSEQESSSHAKSLINRTAVKAYTLAQAEATRAHPFARVSQEWCDFLEATLRNKINSEIRQLPSKGKTIYPSIHISAKQGRYE